MYRFSTGFILQKLNRTRYQVKQTSYTNYRTTKNLRKPGNNSKMSILDGDIASLIPRLPSKSKTLAIAVKAYAKVGIKVFPFHPLLCNFFTLFQIFCPGLKT